MNFIISLMFGFVVAYLVKTKSDIAHKESFSSQPDETDSWIAGAIWGFLAFMFIFSLLSGSPEYPKY